MNRAVRKNNLNQNLKNTHVIPDNHQQLETNKTNPQ